MLMLGPAGSEGLGNIEGMKKAKAMGAKVYEIEFTHGINISKKQIEEIKELNKKLKLILTIHAPYFINLLSVDKKKREVSKKRIIECCRIGNELNAKLVVFHPGFYGKLKKEGAYKEMLNEVRDLKNRIKEKGYKTDLAPETMGKITQWGDLDEILQLSRDLKIKFCIDFAHLKARRKGKIDYEEIIKKLPKSFHSHFSGIEYNEKGEKRHIKVDINEFKKLATIIEKNKKKVTMINESPYIFEDLKEMINALKSLKI